MTTDRKFVLASIGAVVMFANIATAAFVDSAVLETLGPDKSTATLKETLAWLQEQVPRFASATFTSYKVYINGMTSRIGADRQSSRVGFRWLQVNSCTVRYEREVLTEPIVKNQIVVKTGELAIDGKTGAEERDIGEIQLGKLDPATFSIPHEVSGGNSFPDLRDYIGNPALAICADSRVPNNVNSLRSNRDLVYAPSLFCKSFAMDGFTFTNRELTVRVARALKHAAILCGAKVAPF
jgi:hypothetical protein